MLATGKQAQHARGVSSIGGLAEKLAIMPTNDNYGVGSKHVIMRTLPCDRERLRGRQPFGAVLRGFSGQRIFRDVRGLHLECDSGTAEQFLTSRRRGGED